MQMFPQAIKQRRPGIDPQIVLFTVYLELNWNRTP
jgi:hypothetical protein